MSDDIKKRDHERAPDYVERYANNVRFEASSWDLKLIFGMLDQDEVATAAISQHTAIHIPWIQVKLVWYFLSLNIVFQEFDNGNIRLPANTIPRPPAEVFGEMGVTPEVLARLEGLYNQLLSKNERATPAP